MARGCCETSVGVNQAGKEGQFTYCRRWGRDWTKKDLTCMSLGRLRDKVAGGLLSIAGAYIRSNTTSQQ